MSKSIKRLRFVLLILVLFAAACSADDSDSSGDSGDDSAVSTGDGSSTEDGTDDDSSAEDDTGDDSSTEEDTGEDPPVLSDATLRHAQAVTVATWDPHADQRTISLMYLNPVYEGLLRETTDGNDFVPELATSWEQDDTGITFSLREGVTFHDGTAFDASAVVANFERVRADGHPVNRGLLTNIETVEVIDDLTVRYVFAQFDETVLLALARFPGKMVSPAAFDSVGDNNPVGTGPYVYNGGDSAADNSFIAYDRNGDYWNPAWQPFARVEITPITDLPTQLNGLLGGEFDTGMLPAVPLLGQALDGGFVDSQQPSVGIGLHILDRTGDLVPELADERVRKAIALALNREAFYTAVNTGFPTTQQALPGGYAFSEDIDVLDFDLERAKELMAEAGNPEFSIDVPSFGPWNPRNGFIAASLAELGITVNVIDTGNMFAACQQVEGDFPAALCPINERHIKHYVENRLLPDGFLNPFGHTDQDIIDLYEQAEGLPLSEAESLYAEISALAHERGYVAMVGWTSTPIVSNPDTVSGVDVRYIYPGTYFIGDVVPAE